MTATLVPNEGAATPVPARPDAAHMVHGVKTYGAEGAEGRRH